MSDFIDAITPLTFEGYRYFVVLGLMMGRGLGIAIILPVFTRAQLGNPVRAAFAVAIMMPILPAVREDFTGPEQFTNLQLAYIGVKELLLGLLLGILIALPFWAVQATGELIDSQRGVTNADLEDPGLQGQVGIISNLLILLSIVMFLSMDGMHLIVDLVYDSYGAWPLLEFTPQIDQALFDIIKNSIDYILLTGFLIASPFILIFFICDYTVSSIGRFSPKMVSMDVSVTIKNLVFCFLISIYMVFVINYIESEEVKIMWISDRIGFSDVR